MIVRELITRLGFVLDRKGQRDGEAATQRIKAQANDAARAVRNIFSGFVAFQSVRGIVQMLDDMQNLRSRIEMLPQTVGDVNEAFDEVVRRASAAGQSVEAYGALYSKLGQAGKDYIGTQEELLAITDTISKALVVGGASTQESAAAMTQFAQALASGVLQGDEFRSMAEAAPQYLDKLSQVMGIPREQLKKMASEGKLTSRAVVEATKQMADYFDDRFNQMPMTIGRSLTIIANRFKNMLDRMNRDTGFVQNVANTILAVFTKIEAGVNSVVAAFDGWANVLRFVGALAATVIAAKIIPLVIAFGSVSAAVLLPWLKIAAAIAAVSLALEDLYVWIQGGDSLIGDLIGPWEEWRAYVVAAVTMVGDMFKWLGTMIASIAATLVGMFTFDWNLMKEGLKGVWEGVKSAAGTVGAAMGGTGGDQGLAGIPGPQQVLDRATGRNTNIQNNTQVNVTVPPGTPQEQAEYLRTAAADAFAKQQEELSRDILVYAP